MSRRLLTAAALVTALAGLGCPATPPRPGGSASSKAEAARKQAESLAVTAATGAAAQARGKLDTNLVAAVIAADASSKAKPPAPPPDASKPAPRSSYRSSPVVVRERVASPVPYTAEADADEEAVAAAQDAVERKLAELDPPVVYRPSANEVRTEFLRRDTRAVRSLDPAERAELERYKLDPKRVYVEYDVEVTADQIRELRTRDRVGDALRMLGVLTAVWLAGFGFLRLDERTKGYLTRWLAVGALALAGGAAAALYLV